jgi:hypothetical protein
MRVRESTWSGESIMEKIKCRTKERKNKFWDGIEK